MGSGVVPRWKCRNSSHGLEARALTFHIFEATERKRRGRGVVPVVMARSCEFLSLAPLGERVASHRRCHQPGREG